MTVTVLLLGRFAVFIAFHISSGLSFFGRAHTTNRVHDVPRRVYLLLYGPDDTSRNRTTTLIYFNNRFSHARARHRHTIFFFFLFFFSVRLRANRINAAVDQSNEKKTRFSHRLSIFFSLRAPTHGKCNLTSVEYSLIILLTDIVKEHDNCGSFTDTYILS